MSNQFVFPKASFIVAAVVGLIGPLGAASATPIDSLPGNTLCTSYLGPCTTIAITPHGAWQPNFPDGSKAVWISYDKTGVSPDNVLTPPNGTPTINPDGKEVLLTVQEVLNAGPDVIDVAFKTWADDTANLYVDNSLIKGAIFTQATCASAPISCPPNLFYLYTGTLGPGTHTIKWEVFQDGTGTTNDSNPFGLLYAGNYTQVVPEPTTLSLLGGGLLALGFLARRRRRLLT